MSKKKLVLEQTINPHGLITDAANKHVWQVRKVTGSTTPRIHDTLTRTEVDKYCERDDWEVSIQ